MVRRATNTKTTKKVENDKKSGDSVLLLGLLGYALLIVGTVFGFGVFYLICFATGTEHIKVSLLSLPGLFIAELFDGDIVTPFFIAAISIIGGACIFKFGDKLLK